MSLESETCAVLLRWTSGRVVTKILRSLLGRLRNGLIIQGDGHLILDNWIHDIAATFWVNNRQIYLAYCSFLVRGGLFDTGSRPSVVDE